MRKAVFAVNITADGYCSHTDGIADDELHEYFTGLIRQADVVLFGRKTYQLMFPFWHTVAESQTESRVAREFALAIDSVNKIVFTRAGGIIESRNTTISRADIEAVLKELKDRPGKDIYVSGLSVGSQLMRLGLIDKYYFVVHPVVAGRGPRLFEFDSLKESIQLKLVGTKVFQSGVMALHYRKQ